MKRDILSTFELKHNLKLITQEAGFGQVVTGFIPKDSHMFIQVDDNLTQVSPESAYKHSNILAVIGSGFKAKGELIKWLKAINDNDLYVSKISIDDNSRQAQEMGNEIYTLKQVG